MNHSAAFKSCLNKGYAMQWKGYITGVCCPMRVDEETVAR